MANPTYPYDEPEYYAPEYPYVSKEGAPEEKKADSLEAPEAPPVGSGRAKTRGEKRARRKSAEALGFAEGEEEASPQVDADLYAPQKKLAGVGFWLIFLLALAKDASDVLANLSLFLAVATTVTGILIGFTIFLYLILSGVYATDKYLARKLAIPVLAVIIEIIPFLNFIPTYAITLLVLRWMENGEYAQKLARLYAVKRVLKDKNGPLQKRIRNRKARRLREARRRRDAAT